MKKLLIILSFLPLLAHAQLVANAGADFSQPDSIPFAVLSGSASGGTAPYTYSWRTIAKPNGNGFCGNIYNPSSQTPQVTTGIFSSPFGTNYKFELTVTDAASATAKDTVMLTVNYSTPAPPQATGSGWHYVTSADSITDPYGQMSPSRKDVWIDGATTDAYGAGGKKVNIDIRNAFALHNDSRIFFSAGRYWGITLYIKADSILNDSLHPWRAVPYGGQVEWFGTWTAGGCYKNGIISGKFDQVNKTGSPNYRGHDGGYAFSSGTYGFYCNNGWRQFNTPAFEFGGLDSIRNMEIAYCEGPHGGSYFSHIANTSKSSDMYSITIDNNYGIDAYVEGNYWGGTPADPQQTAYNWKVYNNRFVRSGLELDQFGQNGQGNYEHNNVFFMASRNWISPFEYAQGFNGQRYYRRNGNINESNIYVGCGQQLFSGIANLPSGVTLTADTNYIRNDIFFNAQGSKDGYFATQNGGAFHWVISNCWFAFRPHTYMGRQVYDNTTNDYNNLPYPILFQNDFGSATMSLRHIRYDTSGGKTRLDAGTAGTTYFDTASAVVLPLNFVNSGFPDNTTIANNLFRWANIIGGTNKDEDVPNPGFVSGMYTWKAGMYCQHLGWIYLCKADNTNQPPARVEDAYWKPVTWTKPDGSITHIPPDDLRLPSTDFYAKQGIGLLDQLQAGPCSNCLTLPVRVNYKSN